MSKKHHHHESHTEQPAAETKPADAKPAESNGAMQELQSLRQELEQATDHALRCAAELENYRKRAARELADERRYANMGLLRDLLPVIDNFRRAIEAGEKASDVGSLLAGVQMVEKQLEGVLERHQCLRIQTLNEPFDPSVHEAVAQQPSAECPAQSVLMEILPGYRLHDRVVRAAQVIVSSGPAQPPVQEGA